MTQTGNTTWTEEAKVGEGYNYDDAFVSYDDEEYNYDVYSVDTTWTEELPN